MLVTPRVMGWPDGLMKMQVERVPGWVLGMRSWRVMVDG